MAILSSIATFHTPGLRLPASGDLQLFSSSHPFEKYEMEFKHKFGFERDMEPENEVNMPLRSVIVVMNYSKGPNRTIWYSVILHELNIFGRL